MMENDEEIILETYSLTEAKIIKNLLEEYDIFCRFIKEVPDILPFTLNGLGRIRIAVNKKDAEKAKELLKDFQSKENNK